MIDTVEIAGEIRKLSLKMVYEAKASHIGGSLSMADILAVLYSNFLNVDHSNPDDPNRDRFLLSKGHACTGLYSVLALKGFFPFDELSNYGKDGSLFISHTNHLVPGVEISAGSLGHALSVSCGLAIAAKRKKAKWKTYCLISDGELDEGSNWESILYAPQVKLDNLILIVDYNKIQSLGSVKEVLDLNPLPEKFKAFRWETFEVDGHDHKKLNEVFRKALKPNNKPKVIIAHTIKGKGVSFMEDSLLWHYKSPNEKQFNEAIEQINTSLKKQKNGY
jgi:transketolase